MKDMPALVTTDGRVEALACFERSTDRVDGLFVADVQKPFKPKGLMIWGVGAGDVVRIATIGRDHQLSVSFGDLPARWFSTWQSFADIAKAVDEGKEPPGWGEWSFVQPGLQIRILLSHPDPGRVFGPSVELLMWGYTTGR